MRLHPPDPLPFETPRLLVGWLEDRHLETFVAYRSDPEVARYQSWSDYDAARGQALIDALKGRRFGEEGWAQLAIERRGSGEHVGDLAVRFFDEGRQAELGFTLAPPQQGLGYVTEAARGLLGVLFGLMELHRVIAITDEANAAAIATLERLGLRLEGRYRKNVFFKGAWGDERSYALLREEWGR